MFLVNSRYGLDAVDAAIMRWKLNEMLSARRRAYTRYLDDRRDPQRWRTRCDYHNAWQAMKRATDPEWRERERRQRRESAARAKARKLSNAG
jgi:hypothetical protein